VAGNDLLRVSLASACDHSWLFKNDVRKYAPEQYLLGIGAVIQLTAANLQKGGFWSTGLQRPITVTAKRCLSWVSRDSRHGV
jgi:hypothetical protein